MTQPPPIVPGPDDATPEPDPPTSQLPAQVYPVYQPQPVYQPPPAAPEPALPKPVTGTLWVLLTLVAVFCGLPLLCWAIVLVFGGIGAMLPD